MIFLKILLIVLAAILVSVLFFYALRTRGPWGSFWSFLLILTLAGIAAEAWLNPIGPVAFGMAWIPVLFVIVIFGLLLGAASPKAKKGKSHTLENNDGLTRQETTALALGAFFWLLVVVLLGIIVWSFVGGHPLQE